MAISYKKLFHLLIERDIKKMAFCEQAGISPTSMAKLGKNLNVNTEILDKICMALNCDIGDICEITYDKNSRKEG